MTILNTRKMTPPTSAMDIIDKTDFEKKQAEYDEYEEQHSVVFEIK